MKAFLKYVLATAIGVILGCMTLLFFLFVFFVGAVLTLEKSNQQQDIPKSAILKMDLNVPIVDHADDFDIDLGEDIPFLGRLNALSLSSIQQALTKAAADKQIKGIYLRARDVQTGWASVKSLRDMLVEFKKSGKFIYFYSDYLSEKAFYLASIADKTVMPQMGEVEMNGLATTPVFFKSLLTKLDVTPRIFRVGKYKSAVEPFLLDHMSEENKLQTQKLMDDIWSGVVAEFSKRRNIPANYMWDLIDKGLVRNAEDAKRMNLLDQIAAEPVLLDEMKNKIGIKDDLEKHMMPLKKYIRYAKRNSSDEDEKKGESKIAVIYASGELVLGGGSEDKVGSDNVVKMLRQARKNKEVKGIVLRINSPGGHALAADVIWEEIEVTKKTLPVYVSFGDLAASGGYYIAAGAKKIFAEPMSITGSIGVFGLMFGTQEFFNKKLGVHFDRVVTNHFADIGNANRPITTEEEKIIQADVERVYTRFTDLVSKGRALPIQRVKEIAEGRVWSGVEAQKIGLVDELGGLSKAVSSMAKDLKLANYQLEEYPKGKGISHWLDLLTETQVLGGVDLGKFISFKATLEKALKAKPHNEILALMPYELEMN